MHNKLVLRFAAAMFLATVLAGCATVREKHYFATYSEETATSPERLVNIFQLDVQGEGFMSNVRYLAGNYDERAVDYFLNESKSSDYDLRNSTDGSKFPGIWNLTCPDKATDADPCKETWDKKRSVIPLTAGGVNSNDAFVIIISTNANAISETIGAIAESSTTMQSLSYLMNKDTFDAQAAIGATAEATATHRSVFLNALDAQMTGYETATAANADRELGILKMLAAELDPGGPAAFDTLEGARAWFATVR
jgi:hypothetical protein